MKYLLGLVVVILVLGTASARPDFGERVRRALETKGISLEKVLSKQRGFIVKDVGDIWSDCGKNNIELATES